MSDTRQNEFGLDNLDQDCMDSINLDDMCYEDQINLDSDFDDLIFEDDVLLF